MVRVEANCEDFTFRKAVQFKNPEIALCTLRIAYRVLEIAYTVLEIALYSLRNSFMQSYCLMLNIIALVDAKNNECLLTFCTSYYPLQIMREHTILL